jgi:tRNA1(Val) A37 N6-methylase TrmN6
VNPALDRVYTPQTLSALVAKSIQLKNPARLADFAMGDGALLRAVRKRFKHAELVGNDIDPAAIEVATTMGLPGTFIVSDFLLDAPSPDLAPYLGRIDVVLLNPPFTCRGNRRLRVATAGGEITCSQAMAFVLNSLAYLSSGGELLAVLPTSCLKSEKDAAARHLLREAGRLEILSTHRNAFQGQAVGTNIVRLRRGSATKVAKLRKDPKNWISAVSMRGTLPTRAALVGGEADPLYIHSTHLRDGGIFESETTAVRSKREIIGPVLLIPRVGRPSRNKLAIANLSTSAVPSDCVIALQTLPPGLEEKLRNVVLNDWDVFAAIYSASCAPYVTMSALAGFFAERGVKLTQVNDWPSAVKAIAAE